MTTHDLIIAKTKTNLIDLRDVESIWDYYQKTKTNSIELREMDSFYGQLKVNLYINDLLMTNWKQ